MAILRSKEFRYFRFRFSEYICMFFECALNLNDEVELLHKKVDQNLGDRLFLKRCIHYTWLTS